MDTFSRTMVILPSLVILLFHTLKKNDGMFITRRDCTIVLIRFGYFPRTIASQLLIRITIPT